MVGQIVENFTLNDGKGNVFNLYENLDKKILLVFYPKDNSPVCSKQLSDYSKNQYTFNKNNIKIIGVNPDKQEKHQSFCDGKGIDFPLLVDSKKEICKRFNAVNFMGGIKRKLVLIDTDKKIIFEKNIFPVFYLNSEQVLNALKENSSKI